MPKEKTDSKKAKGEEGQDEKKSKKSSSKTAESAEPSSPKPPKKTKVNSSTVQSLTLELLQEEPSAAEAAPEPVRNGSGRV